MSETSKQNFLSSGLVEETLFLQRELAGRGEEIMPFRFNLSTPQLLLFSATFYVGLSHSPRSVFGEAENSRASAKVLYGCNKPKFLICNDSVKKCEVYCDCLNELTVKLNIEEKWHCISGELSENEISGDVNTGLSTAFHQLISNSSKYNFVLPASLLDLKVPDQGEYQAKTVTLYRYRKISLSELTNLLSELGYVRTNVNVLDNGTMRVRGEQLEIKHANLEDSLIVTFYGSQIEKLEYSEERRKKAVREISLPPSSFPAKKIALKSIWKDFSVIRPGYVNHDSPAAVIYDSLHPQYRFPQVDHLSCLERGGKEQKSISGDLVAELKENRPAVHSDHGIGIFEGVKKREINNVAKDYLVLRYAAGDMLSVPVEHSYKVSAYLGDINPAIQRLDSIAWRKSRREAQKNALLFARDLVKTAAARKESTRPPYVISSELEDALEKTFPFELTADQAESWSAIKEDMTAEIPMDRLIVGDVGFGKTEVAIRAARHAVNNGRQVAILAPTTLLVQQHYDTLLNRLPELKDSIFLLSRFSQNQDVARVHDCISKGSAKIVVGTHAVLNKKIEWHTLGMAIIDEEQKFGVTQKEHFKRLRSGLDILSLSATPIPRTLYLSISGLKQLSVISTPPAGRKNVQTKVAKSSPEAIREAVDFEVKRGGQVYIVAPRIRKLNEIAAVVQQYFPDAGVAILHSKLPTHQIARVMRDFDNQKIDILVSSIIIANGLDLPNANTLIVTSATHFGLSNLYQLRGRIGRRKRQGFAYFLYGQGEMTNAQRQRLSALIEASRLGSGWALAQRDLEIRGAGNILGADQSGAVNAVGVQLYLDMVRDAMDNQTSRGVRRLDVSINLPLSAYIPTFYMSDLDDRTNCYQRLSRARSKEEIKSVYDKIQGEYGPAPKEFEALYLVFLLQQAASEANIVSIDSQYVTPPQESNYYKIFLTGLEDKNIDNKVVYYVDRVDNEAIKRLIAGIEKAD